ncbi:hypothetical protein SpiGrapes_0282 [Sphaerochaeta pleomorpha str. Grapes]|uniref:Thioredoxin domain-containing protein n=1 Tax=Sphaerochaeta pleomorpha (strain ATCC BAA-1885 / DSM 22778 / Grapes) TaxID=158190 RepID=G8QUW6_SPHPG|nr:hypothetical protein [Sphaerochaeta pleomorpha]AEV28142.1 hypothetical protein SpiGrapes_0282 [Sphaerochaeta pleomorpha str. Grapes]
MSRKIVLVIILVFAVSLTLTAESFAEVKTKTADGNSFTFPEDALQTGPALFAMAISKTRQNGEEQQQILLQWQTYFNENPSFLAGLPVYHFPVIGSVPFFVKGAIRGGIAKTYAPFIGSDRLAVVFISDAETFFAQAGIPIDEEPTLAFVVKNGTIKGFLKGGVTEENLFRLKELVSGNK